MLFLKVYCNLSISSTFPFKYVTFSYLHVDVIDIVSTTTITISIRRGLIKTHVEFIKKGHFLQLKNLYVKAKTDYDKRDFNRTIELSIAIKVTTILAFDPFVKLHFRPKDIIHSFSHYMRWIALCYNHHCLCYYWIV
jgi:hypothetical protein